MKTYSLDLNEIQADTIVLALDLFARVGTGQYVELLNHPTVRRLSLQGDKEDPLRSIEDLRSMLETIKTELDGRLPPQGYHSIRSENIEDVNRVAYDLFQVIRHRRSWDAPTTDAKKAIATGDRPFGVNFDEPYKTSEQPLARIEPNEIRPEG